MNPDIYLRNCCGVPGKHGDHQIRHKVVNAVAGYLIGHDQLNNGGEPVLSIGTENLKSVIVG